MSDAVISVTTLSKWYGQVIGLNDVTAAVSPGITGLLGPNGAGKSTFLKLVTGQLRPSKGQVHVLGQPIWRNPAIYRRIGYCPDHDTFYERMTGLEWITALLRLTGFTDDEAVKTARRALDTVSLLDVADMKIGAYSKGMRQRVKLAQAVAHDPDLLVLDEPFTGMDPVGRRRTMALVKSLVRAGKSIIISSHILYEIELMTSTILLMHNGRILAEGNVHQIRDLLNEHPHRVQITASDPRQLARQLLDSPYVIGLSLQEDGLTVQTNRPDEFYTRLTALAADGAVGAIDEVLSLDDNLKSVFSYLVTQ